MEQVVSWLLSHAEISLSVIALVYIVHLNILFNRHERGCARDRSEIRDNQRRAHSRLDGLNDRVGETTRLLYEIKGYIQGKTDEKERTGNGNQRTHQAD